jgi:hypothetical protein
MIILGKEHKARDDSSYTLLFVLLNMFRILGSDVNFRPKLEFWAARNKSDTFKQLRVRP